MSGGIAMDGFATVVRADDPVVRDHRVHGVPILPGVVYLDTVLRAAVAAGYRLDELIIREVLFQRPVAPAAGTATRLMFRVDRASGRIRVEGQPLDPTGAPSGPVLYLAECVVEQSVSTTSPSMDIGVLDSAPDVRGLEEMYAQSGGRGIEHRDFMRARGRFRRVDDTVTAELTLGPEATAYLPGFLLHPTFLDASTIVAFVDPARLGVDDDSAFVPIYFDTVRAWRPTPERVFVTASARGGTRTDLLEADVRLHDGQGLPIAEYRLVSKRVRGSADIRRPVTATASESPTIVTFSSAPRTAATTSVENRSAAVLSGDGSTGAPAAEPTAVHDPSAVIAADLLALVAEELGVDVTAVATDVGFYELGLDSSRLLRLTALLEQRAGQPLYPTLLFEYQTVDALATYLAETVGARWRSTSESSSSTVSFAEPVPHVDIGPAERGGVPDSARQPDESEYRAADHRAPGEMPREPVEWPAPVDGPVGTTAHTAPIRPHTASRPENDEGETVGPAGHTLVTFEYDWILDDSAPAPVAPTALLVFDTADEPYPTPPASTFLVRVRPGDHYTSGADGFTVDPTRPEHLRAVLDELAARGLVFDAAVYGWSTRVTDAEEPENLVEAVYLPLRDLVQAVSGSTPAAPVRRILAVSSDSATGVLSHALAAGFARSLRLETPTPTVRAVLCEQPSHIPTVVAAELAVADHETGSEVCYRAGRRRIRIPRELPAPCASGTAGTNAVRPVEKVFEAGVVAVVTGGFGGIGRVLALRMAREHGARLVLVSRRALDASGAALLARIAELGGEAIHVRADVSEAADTDRLAAIARATFGRIDVVFHAAGVLRDGLIAGSPREAAAAVLAPKVRGSMRLLRSMPDARLLVLFSSVSAVLGNPGQADYAAANRWLDAVAEYRSTHRVGTTRVVDVAWPLWAEGGMRPPEAQIDALRASGMVPLPTEVGLDLVLSAHDRPYTACVWGDRATIVRRLFTAISTSSTGVTGVSAPVPPTASKQPNTMGDSGAQDRDGTTPNVPPVARDRLPDETALAIVGYSGRFPDADDISEFWRNLRAGHDAVGPVPAERGWPIDYGRAGRLPTVGGFLREVGAFDPRFFRIPPAHAPLLDPQERLFLQQAYAALEHAGYHPDDPTIRQRRVGVFAAATWSDYRLLGAEATARGDNPVAVASIPSSIANRTSYTLGLRGPSLTVDTACSGSLTALHLARRSILDGECDAAVVGGVNLLLHPDKFLLLRELGMMSTSGRCRPFGADADGYVPGEGVGAVYLKPLATALADGDTVHGLVLGSAVNHGGRTAGYSVPHPEAQAEVIARALAEAGARPDDIDYLEAHGTGTPLGDPIEITGLTTVFGSDNRSAARRAIGSVKSNIGHLEAAAGIAGLIRVLLQFRHGQIAPTLHADRPNPVIDPATLPFHLPRSVEDWPRRDPARGRMAGISAFGAGGANAHVVVAEFVDDRAGAHGTGDPEIVVLSARTPERLRRYAELMARHFRDMDSADFTDSARTLQIGRPALPHRLALVAVGPRAVADALDSYAAGTDGAVHTGTVDSTTPTPAIDPNTPPERLAELWVSGAQVDWSRRGGPIRRMSLPGYPFERHEYWITETTTALSVEPENGTDTIGVHAPDAAPILRAATGQPREAETETGEAGTAVFRRFESRPRASRPTVALGEVEVSRYAALLLFATFADLGLAPGAHRIATLADELGILPRYHRLLTACVDILREHGLIRVTGELLTVPGPPPGTTWMRADLVARYPHTQPYVRLLDVCLTAYPRVLRGDLAATEVLFPGGDLDLVGAIYHGNPGYDAANTLLAELVSAAAVEHTGPVLRVLEVGAGTGGTTHAVLAALEESGVEFEYHYTDISPGLVAHGRRVFGDHPQLRFAVFDLTADPLAQGVAEHGMDLVVCANVLHAVAAIAPTLGNLRRVLAPGGLLACLETTTDREALALTFGLLDGWHAYTDPHLRLPNSPLLSEDGWRAALSGAGFADVRAYGAETADGTDPGYRVLAAVSPAATAPSETAPAVRDAPTTGVADIVAECLDIAADDLSADLPISDYGVDSILAVKIVDRINTRYGLDLRPTVVFDHPTVRRLAERITIEVATAPPPAASSGSHPGHAAPVADDAPGVVPTTTPAPRPLRDLASSTVTPSRSETASGTSLDIAVIGMSGRFPGSADLDEFWADLCAGRDMVTEIPPRRRLLAEGYRSGTSAPEQIAFGRGGFLDDIDLFDPVFFDIVPAEADYMDPQQRLFLEHGLLALEDAAIDPKSLRRKRCGVFVGSPGSDYAALLRSRTGIASPHVFTGNSPAILPARIAYHLDLTGPCIGLDTACSSALVAVHQACRSIASGESELALAGGVAVFVTPEYHLLASAMGMLSPRGRCASFDAEADGFVIAEGVGAVVLKSLDAARRDGDPIHGVIRGIGVNHDGRTFGITAPSARSQTELELQVYRRYGIDPSEIGYVETHGTGTRLGDPVEIEALTAAFRQYTDTVGTIAIGSVKSHIGHASHAAGMAGLFAVLLGMRAGTIPPSLHLNTVNPLLGLADSPFYVNTEPREWPAHARTAAVSSFGFSGTNAHLVVSAPPDVEPVAAAPDDTGRDTVNVVVLSARSPRSLRDGAYHLARHLETHPEHRLRDIAHTLAVGRTAFEHRLAIVADSRAALIARLRATAAGNAAEFAETVFLGESIADIPQPERSHTTVAEPTEAARRWAAGEPVACATWYLPDVRRLHLPGYRFDRQRCWFSEAHPVEAADAEPAARTPTIAPPDPDPEKTRNPATPRLEVGATGDEIRRVAENYLKGLLAGYCRLDPDRIRTRRPLQDYGIDSVLVTTMTERMCQDFGSLPGTLFFEYRTVRELAEHLAREYPDRLVALAAESPAPTDTSGTVTDRPSPEVADREHPRSESTVPTPPPDVEEIAVIGMAGKFPMAGDIEEFWENLVAGRDCIIEVPSQRWNHRDYLSDDIDEPGTTYVRWGGFIDDVDCFDAPFFGVTPKDAEEMDPQQRLFLETCWAALEDAGYPPERLRAHARGLPDAGVFVGVGYAEYQAFVGVPISGYFAVANRVSYHFGFTGPSLAVDTACSASLTALHLACESLRRGECAYALAGGVNVSIHPGKYLLLGYGRWASSDGRCRSFGAGGDGYVPGEGVVTLVLKPLRHALRDGDRIHGVIRGSAINHGGHTNGFTVPNPNAQAELIERALTTARVDPGDIEFVEAHGTGTALGDPIEIAALSKAYRRSTDARGYCGIGSAKSVIGHLEAAAGAAGVVKALLQLRENTMAPNLHGDPPNPAIDFAASPFRVIDAPTPWPRHADGSARITAVSSFGAGGANAHLILTDAAAPELPASEDRARIVVLSARDGDRLTETVERLVHALRRRPARLADVAWTLAVGRRQFTHRLAVVASSTEELLSLLTDGTAAEGLLVFRGVAPTHRQVDELPGESESDRARIRSLLRSGNLPRVAEMWASGWTVDWENAYETPFGRIVGLPTYPFARKRYWIVPEDYRRRTDPRAGSVSAADPEPDPRPAGVRDDMRRGTDPTRVSEGSDRWSISQDRPLRAAGGAPVPQAHRDENPMGRLGSVREHGTAARVGAGGDIAAEARDGAGEFTGPARDRTGGGHADETDENGLRTRLYTEIRDIFADLTKTDAAELDLDAEFIDFGFDSVTTVRMLNRVMKRYDVHIPAESTELYPTIRAFGSYLVDEGIITPAAHGETARSATGVESASAAESVEEIAVITLDRPISVESVFVTGVTGVLGGKLLCDLLATTDTRITCLVRGTSMDAAIRRIRHFLTTYDPDDTLAEAFAERVTVLLGDVSRDRFGLDETTWRRLAADTDLTIHAAGRTTLVGFYEQLAPINVAGTARAVEFALHSRGRYLIYVSSFSALGDRLNFNNPPFTERDLELGQGYDHLPYQRTKYESEKLIRAASARGLRWDIVRPGNIMGDSVTGRYPFSEVSVKGAYYDILKTMVETGQTMLTPVHWDITPVDYVTAAIVHIALHRPTYRETYHLTNPDIRRYYDVVQYVREAGYPVEFVPLEEFHRRVTERLIRWRDSNREYQSQTLEMFKYGIELFGMIHYEESSYADCAYTRGVLGAVGIDCPSTRDLVRTYLEHCARVGYLPSPQIPAEAV
ncbi:thioester reductase domain-containing protein [Nocardia paucivorans]|uniref:thioester reductase domain-containing protein n=1 Tax=Nocardia paucivorans TaxID=114259 RepID=UPI0002D93D0A|nr:thioester reductase domain-containing protein [Nocardia paucivorans]